MNKGSVDISGRKIGYINGTPQGVVDAPVGSLYTDTISGRRYKKQSGTGNTGWVLDGIHSFTETQRDALSWNSGDFILNITTNSLEKWSGTEWIPVSGGGGGGGGFDSMPLGTSFYGLVAPDSSYAQTNNGGAGFTYLKSDYEEVWSVAGLDNINDGEWSQTFPYPIQRMNATSYKLLDKSGYIDRTHDISGTIDPDGATRGVGSFQDYATALPNNPFITSEDGEHIHTLNYRDNTGIGTATPGGSDFLSQSVRETNPAGIHFHTIDSGGDSETRPKNISWNHYIKVKTRVPLQQEYVPGENITIVTSQQGNTVIHTINSNLPETNIATPSQLPNPNYFKNPNFSVLQKGINYNTISSGNEGVNATGIVVRRKDGSVNEINTTMQFPTSGHAINKRLWRCIRRPGTSNTASIGAMLDIMDSDLVRQVFAGKNLCFSISGFHGDNYSSASPIQIRIYGSTIAEDPNVTPFGYTEDETENLLGTQSFPSINKTALERISFFVAIPADIKSLVISAIQPSPQGTAGSIDGFYIAECKTEVGSVATPFSLKPQIIDRQEVLTFHEILKGSSSNSTTGLIGMADGPSTIRTSINYKVYKRKTPIITVSNQDLFNILRNGTNTISSAITFSTIEQYSARVDITTADPVSGGEAVLPTFKNAAEFIQIKAFNYTEGL